MSSYSQSTPVKEEEWHTCILQYGTRIVREVELLHPRYIWLHVVISKPEKRLIHSDSSESAMIFAPSQ